ncbi:cytochrome P450 [Coprinopsis marcescibilis]|uniref:Cytochrome P450 n=1 Tax=Coprinopsis marcescibilis TaxID=230819 RepID=A0A5C3KI77_COPMA|nr:cytochrome P450 [Coprinopsis marcescibilis]
MGWFISCGFVLVLLYSVSVWYQYRCRRQIDLPAIGYEGLWSSYWTAFRCVRHAKSLFNEGYLRVNKNGLFKIPLWDRWFVVAAGDKYLSDIKAASDTVLSMMDGAMELLKGEYTLGPQFISNQYHLAIFRTMLSKDLNTLLPELLDEVFHATLELFPEQGHEWNLVCVHDALRALSVRVSSRILVGLPLCRNKEYHRTNVQFAHSVMFGASLISFFPRPLQSIVGKLYHRFSTTRHRNNILKHVSKAIEDRRLELEQLEPNESKPNELISWLLDLAPPGLERETASIAFRILLTNFSANHATSGALISAVYCLAAEPRYIKELRDEIESILGSGIEYDTWNLKAIDRCEKLDSFLKESIRLHGVGAFSVLRKALTHFRFSDGTVLPPGTIISACGTNIHLDEDNYPDAHTFDGLRFYKLRQQEPSATRKHTLASGDDHFLAFGIGKSMCPGRFFASMVMKCNFINLILNYDFDLEEGTGEPVDEWLGPISLPSSKAKILVRRRVPA